MMLRIELHVIPNFSTHQFFYPTAIVQKILGGSIFSYKCRWAVTFWPVREPARAKLGFIHEEYYVTYSGSFWPTVSSFCGITDRFLLRKTRSVRSATQFVAVGANKFSPKNEIQYGVRNSCYPGGIDLGALCISRFDGDFRYCRHRPSWSRSLAGVIIPQAR